MALLDPGLALCLFVISACGDGWSVGRGESSGACAFDQDPHEVGGGGSDLARGHLACQLVEQRLTGFDVQPIEQIHNHNPLAFRELLGNYEGFVSRGGW